MILFRLPKICLVTRNNVQDVTFLWQFLVKQHTLKKLSSRSGGCLWWLHIFLAKWVSLRVISTKQVYIILPRNDARVLSIHFHSSVPCSIWHICFLRLLLGHKYSVSLLVKIESSELFILVTWKCFPYCSKCTCRQRYPPISQESIDQPRKLPSKLKTDLENKKTCSQWKIIIL